MATVEVACYATAWTIAYLGIRTLLFPHMSADYSNRAVSIGHAVIAMVMASASIPSMWHPFSRIGGSTTPAEVPRYTSMACWRCSLASHLMRVSHALCCGAGKSAVNIPGVRSISPTPCQRLWEKCLPCRD